MRLKTRNFLPRIAALLSLLVIMALGSVAITAQRIADAIDEEARASMLSAIRNGVSVIQSNQTARSDINYSDRAYRGIVLDRDPAAIRRSMYGAHLADRPDFMIGFLVDPEDRVPYASDRRGPPPAETARELAAAVRPVVELLRERARDIVVGSDSAPAYASQKGRLLAIEGLVEADLASIGGRPAIVIAAALLPENPKLLNDRRPTIVINAIFFNIGLYEMMAHAANVESLGPPEPGKATFDLTNRADEVVASVSTDFAPPGRRILDAARPVFLGSFALFLLMAGVAVAVLQRLTAQLAEREAAALHTARHDALTGLANRGWFRANLAARIEAAQKGGARFVLALIDLDYFKPINDTFGHAAGDAVLVAVSERLKALGGSVALAGRLGGDEFVALSPDLSPEAAAEWGRSLRLALMRPATYGEAVIDVSTSIGLALADGCADAELTKRADLALYRAKRDGRGCERLFDPALDREEAEAAADVASLREAARKLRGDAAVGGVSAAA